MNKTTKGERYTPPGLQLYSLPQKQPIMLSYDTDPNQGSWELLMKGTGSATQNG